MNERRRRFLCYLGGTGLASVTGCLRLEQQQSIAEEAETTAERTRSTTGEEQSTAEKEATRSTTATEADLVVSVTGRQFAWEFAYPESEVSERDELVLPVGETVELQVRSEDVYHAFGVPEFGLTVEALPEELTETNIEATETGTYDAYCTEYCGAGHSEMTATVRVVSESEFDDWRS